MSNEISRELRYASPPPWRQRRGYRRLLFIAAAVIVVLGICCWGPPAWKHMRLLYWQRQCMSYRAPADLVVFSGAVVPPPASAPRGAGSPNDAAAAAAGSAGSDGGAPGLGADEPGYFHLKLGQSNITYCIPPPWHEFSECCDDATRISNGTLFLGHRKSSGGNDRLVAVDLYITHETPHRVFATTRIIRAGSILSSPVEAEYPNRDFLVADDVRNIRMFAGQPDAGNPAHFTIEYTTAPAHAAPARASILDGWLHDNDTVLIERRSPSVR